MKNIDIESFLCLDGYDTEIRKARRKNSKGTQEFFTPYSIVRKMCDKIPEEDWKDKKKTFCEPCIGNGQFIIYIIYKRLISGISWYDTLKTLYGLELMEDNLMEAKARVIELFDLMGIDYDEDLAMDIMDKNMVCHNFFTWNFDEWREMTEEEIKKSKKK